MSKLFGICSAAVRRGAGRRVLMLAGCLALMLGVLVASPAAQADLFKTCTVPRITNSWANTQKKAKQKCFQQLHAYGHQLYGETYWGLDNPQIACVQVKPSGTNSWTCSCSGVLCKKKLFFKKKPKLRLPGRSSREPRQERLNLDLTGTDNPLRRKTRRQR